MASQQRRLLLAGATTILASRFQPPWSRDSLERGDDRLIRDLRRALKVAYPNHEVLGPRSK